MDIVYSDKVHLMKLFLVSKSSDIIPTNIRKDFYEYADETIGVFDSLEEAKAAFSDYQENNDNVFAYEIIGPEYRYRESRLDVIDDERPDWELDYEEEMSDDSPEYQFLYDSNKNLISSYFYDERKPGGHRIDGEKNFSKGDKAYVRVSIIADENQHYLLIPVIVEGKPTIEYLYNKWKNCLWEIDKRVNGDMVEEPSDVRILKQINDLTNLEKDSLMFRPLVSVRSNWGDCPSIPSDDSTRIDFFPVDIIFRK